MAERTFTFSDETISIENLDDGSHVVKVGRDGTKILAYIVDGKLDDMLRKMPQEIAKHC